MANIDSAAIIAKIREVLEAGAGLIRTIPAGTYAGEANADLSETELSTRAAEKERYRITVVPVRYNAANPMQPANLRFYDIEVAVTVIRYIPPEANDDDDVFDAIMAAAGNDSDRIAQALDWPGNLPGVGLVSDQLRYVSSSRDRTQFPQGGEAPIPGLIESTHQFTGIVRVDAATS